MKQNKGISDKKEKTFLEMLNGIELDYSVLDYDEIVPKFEKFFESEEFQNDYKNWSEENEK